MKQYLFVFTKNEIRTSLGCWGPLNEGSRPPGRGEVHIAVEKMIYCNCSRVIFILPILSQYSQNMAPYLRQVIG